ncbi:MAG: sodium:proton antiporter [Nitrospirota bacterium]|nr:sodium:proton antiporter [Nitrospirota bacterium]
MEYGLTVLAVFLFLYAVSSKRLSLTILTGPLLFVSLGWLTGPSGLEIIALPQDLSLATLLLETTLVLVLFTDAMGINTSRWREDASIPWRLLSIGLPLTLVAGWGLALVMFSDLGLWEAALVAIILAPTDAALGQAVVSNPRVPQRIRQGLNVESGLNDGIALPVFIVFLDAAEASEGSLTLATLLGEIAKELGIALGVGLVLGWLAAKLIIWARDRDWVADGWDQVALLGAAFAAWSLGDTLGGSGFIAAWVAGLLLGRSLRDARITLFAEGTSHILTLLSFFVFGSFVLGQAISVLTWELALYAILSLTIIRMVPVAAAMIGSGLRAPSLLYMGWFGPRGLASIILVATIVLESDLAGASTISLIMTVTVGLSIYAHGVTAWWGSNRYADWYESRSDYHGEMPESADVPDVPVSRRLGHAVSSDEEDGTLETR